jgi:hypothetical protein
MIRKRRDSSAIMLRDRNEEVEFAPMPFHRWFSSLKAEK